jgi:hypothetical protein
MSMFGLNIVPSIMAREIRTTFKVSRWPGRSKKRNGWRVERVEINRPGAWQAGNTIYMHPELIACMKGELSTITIAAEIQRQREIK